MTIIIQDIAPTDDETARRQNFEGINDSLNQINDKFKALYGMLKELDARLTAAGL